MTRAIVVEGLRKVYGDLVAVDGVSFEVGEGEIFGMVGPNGAGKTTTIECVEGLRVPDGGRIEVLGLDPQRDARRLRERIGGSCRSRSRRGLRAGRYSALGKRCRGSSRTIGRADRGRSAAQNRPATGR